MTPGWAGALALLALVASAADASEEGWAEFATRRDADAVAIWRRAAASGDRDAQFGLGIAYDLGRGVPSDGPLACAWYRRAGDAGLAAAEFNAAVMIDAGRCGRRDPALAALWYARAAARGFGRAQYDLGLLYTAGDGVPRNGREARAWFAAAASNGVTIERPVQSSPAPGAELRPVAPVWPVGDEVVAPGPVPLVWTSPEQPGPARFYLEVFALEPGAGDGPASPVRAAYAPRTAETVELLPGAYAWRVLCTDADQRRYVVGPWSSFRVGDGLTPH